MLRFHPCYARHRRATTQAIFEYGAGSLFLTGYTYSEDFPVADAIQGTKGADGCSTAPCVDAFVTKLDASGSALVYSTYLGGGGDDYGMAIALGGGSAFVSGYTESADFPVTGGAYDTALSGTNADAFIARISETAPPPETELNYNWHYEYDGLSRLVSACSDWDGGTGACLGDSFEYTYDGAGDLLSFSRWSGAVVETVNFVYNQANQIVCQDGNGNGACGDPGDVPYSYDAYGNLTSDGVKTYAYDAENRLTSVSDGATTTTYTYNGDGDRVSQTVDGVTTSYVLDTATPLTMVLAETTGTDTIYYLHGLDLVAQNDGTTTEYFGYDGLGSVRQMLDDTGNVLLAQAFDPYGNPYASAGIDSTSWGFTGEMEDGNGLIFLRARYYDPRQGHFLQRDPWQGDQPKPMSYNAWLYGYSNPIRFSDPSGLNPNCEHPFRSFCAWLRLNEIVDEEWPNGAEALFRLFEDEELLKYWGDYAGRTSAQRLEWVLESTRGADPNYSTSPQRILGLFIPFQFGIHFGSDCGLSEEYRDSQFYKRWGKMAEESNQVGHFLSAVSITYKWIVPAGSGRAGSWLASHDWISLEDRPTAPLPSDLLRDVGLASIIGHEKVSDEAGALTPFLQVAATTISDFDRWYLAVEYDERGLSFQRDQELWTILNFKSSISFGEVDQTRIGNSLQDLRLSLKGFRFAFWVDDHRATNPSSAGRWLRRNLSK